MGKKMNQTFKEILQIVVFLVVVGILLTVFVIYPLNRTKAIMGREDVDDYDPDSLAVNDPALFVEAGLPADTFTVEPDVVTRLAGLFIQVDSADTARGTIILLHDEWSDRADLMGFASLFHDSGFAVVVYDQRATGFSGGKYRGEGQIEADDLVETIAYLDYRERAARPIILIGWSLGADAALLAALEEERIDKVVAIRPYLTTERMINLYREQYDSYWLPFFNSLFSWWYEIRSGYASPYRELGSIEATGTRTLLLGSEEDLQADEYTTMVELSDSSMLTVEPVPADSAVLRAKIVGFVVSE